MGTLERSTIRRVAAQNTWNLRVTLLRFLAGRDPVAPAVAAAGNIMHASEHRLPQRLRNFYRRFARQSRVVWARSEHPHAIEDGSHRVERGRSTGNVPISMGRDRRRLAAISR